jgi:hypothetical protein
MSHTGAKAVRNLSFDESTNGRFQIRYEPEGSGDVLYVKPGRPEPGLAGALSHIHIHPLNPIGNPKFAPLEPWDFGPGVAKGKLSQKITPLDGDRVEILLRQEGGRTQTRRVRFWTVPSPPVITEIDDETSLPNGKTNVIHVRLSEFKKCTGGMVARKLLVVSRNAADDIVSVTEWESKDLDSPPLDSDFVIAIGARTKVHGLKDPPTGADRRIDLNTLTEADLGKDPASARQEPRTRSVGVPFVAPVP